MNIGYNFEKALLSFFVENCYQPPNIEILCIKKAIHRLGGYINI